MPKSTNIKIFGIILLLISTTIFRLNAQKVPAATSKYGKNFKSKAASTKLIQVPDPLAPFIYFSPMHQFSKWKHQWMDETYSTTILESNHRLDTTNYTKAMHLSAFRDSKDIPSSYSFDHSQYVGFTDWNKKYHFITIHSSTKENIVALEYLDSLMTRHHFITDTKEGLIIHHAVDRYNKDTLIALPLRQNTESNASLQEIWNLKLVKKEKLTKEQSTMLGVKINQITIGELFRHAELTFGNSKAKAKPSVILAISMLLPEHIGHLVQAIQDPQTMLLELNATYGDKPFYSSKWKTMKIQEKVKTISIIEDVNTTTKK